MSLSDHFRSHFPRDVQRRFTSYWHAMHPVDFSFKKIYRAGFTDAEWEALNLLKKRRSECISSGHRFRYEDDSFGVCMSIDMPKKYKEFPFAKVLGKQIDPALRTHLSDWYHKAKEWDDLHTKCHTYLHSLLATDSEKRSIHGVNTIRQLYAIWPELLPFFNETHRHTCRNTKVRAKLPMHWTTGDVDLWMSKPRMDEISYALTVMTLIPDKEDEHYPALH